MKGKCRRKGVGKHLHLRAETVEGTTGAFECVDDVEGSDGLALGMLGVGD